MNLCKLAVVSGVFLFLVAYDGFSADDAQPKQPEKGRFQKGQFQGRAGGGSLLSTDAVDKLKLSADQKDTYTKINDEYKENSKGMREKAREAFQSKDQDKIREALQSMRTEAEKLRSDYLAKVESMLTADQKKIFAEVKNEQPGRGGFGAFGRGGAGAGQVLSPGIQERLKLTDEQKKKVEDLQKEIDGKIKSILTEEQRKQFDEMKKGGGQPPRRPNAKADL